MRAARTLKRAVCAMLPWLLVSMPAPAAKTTPAPNYAARPEVRAFIAQIAASDGFDAGVLRRLFAQVRYQPSVIAAMSRPLIASPRWHEYAPQFINPMRIGAGVAFWRDNAATLARAQEEFGIPAQIIVAIIGVETNYGLNTGSYRVLDALTTLAFDYPRREEFFRSELKQFLLLAREQGVSPLQPRGSYAGALGLPQFMPGSVRAYAIDYDGDGRIDLAHDPIDAVGSVANFLAQHDWQPGQPVMAAARIETENPDLVLRTLDGGIAERRPLAAWVHDGVTGFEFPGDLAPGPVGLLMLEDAAGPTYWLVFNNWYVLTRYNRSRLYASAVQALAEAVKGAAGR